MDIKTFSQLLREHREEAGISILDLADHLRVSKEVIFELERGEYAPASLDIFRRGYIRQYAHRVGLPEIDVDNYFLGLGVISVKSRVPKQKFNYDQPQKHTKPLRWFTALFVGGMLVLVLIWAFWQHSDPESPIAPLSNSVSSQNE